MWGFLSLSGKLLWYGAQTNQGLGFRVYGLEFRVHGSAQCEGWSWRKM